MRSRIEPIGDAPRLLVAAIFFALVAVAVPRAGLAQDVLLDVPVEIVDQNGAAIPGSFVVFKTNTSKFILRHGDTFVFPSSPTTYEIDIYPGIGGFSQSPLSPRLWRAETRTLPGDPNGVRFVWATREVVFDLVDQFGNPIENSEIRLVSMPPDPALVALNEGNTESFFSSRASPYGLGPKAPVTVTLPVNTGYARLSGLYAHFEGNLQGDGYEIAIVPAIGGGSPTTAIRAACGSSPSSTAMRGVAARRPPSRWSPRLRIWRARSASSSSGRSSARSSTSSRRPSGRAASLVQLRVGRA
jgi:hypothetical protein